MQRVKKKDESQSAIGAEAGLPGAALAEAETEAAGTVGEASGAPRNPDRRISTQGIRFIISGAISAIPDLGLTALALHGFGWNKEAARTLGFIVGTIVAYLINRRWTFQAERSWKRFAQVAVLYTLSYLINIGLTSLCLDLFQDWGLGPAISLVCAFVIAQGTATVVNFFVQRIFIFKAR